MKMTLSSPASRASPAATLLQSGAKWAVAKDLAGTS